jgi:flagellar L-ring protein precursor FlgH
MNRRFWKYALLAISGTVSLFVVKRGDADSIWDRRDQRVGYLFVDNRARRVGDLLTVVVREVTGASTTEERKLDKTNENTGKFTFAGKTATTGAAKSAAAEISSDQTSERKFSGTAGYENDRKFLDQMTVTVIDVLPNGNLVIEGFRKRVVSNETRMLRISGVVRVNDVDLKNSIESKSIAHFSVEYEGSGVESRFTNQGWLSRVGNKVWPW